MAIAIATVNTRTTPFAIIGADFSINLLVVVEGYNVDQNILVTIPRNATPSHMNRIIAENVVSFAATLGVSLDRSDVIFTPLDRG